MGPKDHSRDKILQICIAGEESNDYVLWFLFKFVRKCLNKRNVFLRLVKILRLMIGQFWHRSDYKPMRTKRIRTCLLNNNSCYHHPSWQKQGCACVLTCTCLYLNLLVCVVWHNLTCCILKWTCPSFNVDSTIY